MNGAALPHCFTLNSWGNRASLVFGTIFFENKLFGGLFEFKFLIRLSF